MTSPRERAQLQAALRQQQEALVRDLLPVLDALERAEGHWRQVLEGQGQASAPPQRPAPAPEPEPPRRGWGRLARWWAKLQIQRREPAAAPASAELASTEAAGAEWASTGLASNVLAREELASNVLAGAELAGLELARAELAGAALARSAGEGVELIRAQLLEVLRAHGLEPFESLGQPFDPERMRALGQRPAAGSTPGQVVEEAVRGYGWNGKLLREAQVLVAGP